MGDTVPTVDARELALRTLSQLGVQINLQALIEGSRTPGLVRALIAKGLLTAEEVDAEMRAVQLEALQQGVRQAMAPQLVLAKGGKN